MTTPFLFVPIFSWPAAPGGKLHTYAAGGTTPQTTWSDAAGSVANTNPVTLDSNGTATVRLASGQAYHFVLKDSTDTTTLWDEDNYQSSYLTQSDIGGLLYPTISYETSSGVTPSNNSYPVGDLRRYGAKLDGATDDTTAINNAIKVAIAGLGYIYHPGGNCVHASQILAGNNFQVRGFDRTACIFTYTGSAGSSAWRITNNGTSSPVPNTSGFGRVTFDGVTITTAVGSSTAAGLEINACGYAFYVFRNSRITGTFKYGLIVDGAEVMEILNPIIDNSGPANSANIWIVNGSDRTATQSQGFSNSIVVHGEAQINGATFGIADDGGSNHYFLNSNINGNSIPIRIAGVDGFTISGLEIENAGVVTGEANIDFLTLSLGSTSVGPCQAGVIEGNFFGSDMAAGGTSLKFNGASMHQGIRVHGNWFRNNTGLSADIDVTKLANSVVGPNYSGASQAHYTGVHNDANGNELLPPQNGFSGTFSQAARVFGDSRYVNQFSGGVSADSPNGLQIDEQQWQSFTIQIINNAGTLQVQIFDSGVGASTSAYANKIQNASASAVNLPTISSGAGFGSTPAGIVSGSTSVLVLNVANAQLSGKCNQIAFIEQYTGGVAVYSVYCGNGSRNINSVTISRPEIRLINAQTGAIVNFDTTLLPAGKVINIKFSGYLA